MQVPDTTQKTVEEFIAGDGFIPGETKRINLSLDYSKGVSNVMFNGKVYAYIHARHKVTQAGVLVFLDPIPNWVQKISIEGFFTLPKQKLKIEEKQIMTTHAEKTDDLLHSCMPRTHTGGVLGGPYPGSYPYPFDVAIAHLPSTLETKFESKADLSPQPAHGFLQEAVKQMEARGALRDKPSGERSMAAIVASFNALTNKDLTEAEGWEFMILLKMVRGRQGSYNRDDYVDGAAYFGLLGECESIDPDRIKK